MLALSLAALAWSCANDHSSPPVSQVTPPPGMVYVPGGSFLTGSDSLAADPAVGPLRQESLPAFYIDRTEVSNAQVREVLPDHQFPAGQENRPATGLTWDQATTVLAAQGKRLPTSLEWEKAARGTDGRIYPWGNDPSFEGRAHVGTPRENPACAWGQLVDVDSMPEGQSPFGLHHTLGNAWEWVADPPTVSRPFHLIKGGAYGYAPQYLRLDNTSFEQPGAT